MEMSNRRRLLDALLSAFRPARWSICRFRFVPLLLLAAGVWAVVYGGFYHRIPVSETHVEHFTRTVRALPPMPPPMRPGGLPGMSFGMPPGGPPGTPPFSPSNPFTMQEKVLQLEKTVKTTTDERELAVNRAVTIAGIKLDPQGKIVRVPDAADGPAFCPS
jgi:hypothetical protein